ncbi:polysaccharide biosynthesis protein [bacterium]|nr:polysaccharide biosynthesis protein [bacterium]|tara:strand:- start:2418 stop:3707 length:1290 start_codon:yes stop_codon:yes gene_type:complete
MINFKLSKYATVFFKNIFIYFFSDVFNKALPFLLLPILTRYLSSEDYGIIANYSILLSLSIVFISMNTQGSVEVVFFHITKNKLKKYIGNIFLIISILSLVFLIFYLIFGSMFSKLTMISIEWLIASVFICLAQIINLINLILWRVEKNAKNYSLFEILQNIFNFSLTLLFIIALKMNWEGRLLAIAISNIFFGLISFYLIFKVREYLTFNYNKDTINDALSYGIPLVPHSLATWIKTGLDRLFITYLVGVGATGIYSVGYQLGMVIMIIATALYKAWLPELYGMLKDMTNDKKKQVIFITYAYFIGIIILTIFLYFILNLFIDLFIGKDFSESKIVILFILIAYAFDSMYFAVVPYLFYFKKTKVISSITITTSFIHAPVSYLLIMKYGIQGATYASAITFGLTFFMIFYSSNKIYPMPWFSFWKNNA